MIVLTRVDHRLLHGQVAFSWTNSLGADAILIANDDVVKDEMWKTTLKLAKPVGVKLVIKNIEEAIKSINSGVTDKYKLLIVVSSIKDAKNLIDNVEEIKSLNLGGSKHSENSRALEKSFYITEDEEKMLRELIDKGIEVELRQVANESKKDVKTLI
ncbi:PTS sugar transporter subunit IIB [Helcococcus ovis]|uniref:PTS sugar transporter subunit IIB n=1 Tax=Helcococcus ovis TaxID=72026 RepID=UPI0038BB958B